MVSQQAHPPTKGAGHTRRDESGARHLAKAHLVDQIDRCRGRCGPLAADHLGLSARGVPQDDRHLATETVEVRLDDLQDKARGDCGVECIAAAVEHRHPALRGEPVRGADHSECAPQLRPGGELHGTH